MVEIYQDIWVDGAVEQKGVRDCSMRFEPIRAHCAKYERPFTILDIGANLGYYSFRLTEEFDCTAVMIEGLEDYFQKLATLAPRQRGRDRIILLSRYVDLEDLRALAQSEHFDVVLALRVVHHFAEPYADVVEAIQSLGDNVFMELPTASEHSVRNRERVQSELSDHDAVLKPYGVEKVGEYPIHVGDADSPVYLLKRSDPFFLERPFIGSEKSIRHEVESNFKEKRLKKNDEAGNQESDWIPGINLITYFHLRGWYPSRKALAAQIRHFSLPSEGVVTDVKPWNMVLSGKDVNLIDYTAPANSLGEPFDEDPANCLHNLSMYVRVGLLPMEGHQYAKDPKKTQRQLVKRCRRELGALIRDFIGNLKHLVWRLYSIRFQ